MPRFPRIRIAVTRPRVAIAAFSLGLAVAYLLTHTLLVPRYSCHGYSSGGYTCRR